MYRVMEINICKYVYNTMHKLCNVHALECIKRNKKIKTELEKYYEMLTSWCDITIVLLKKKKRPN